MERIQSARTEKAYNVKKDKEIKINKKLHEDY